MNLYLDDDSAKVLLATLLRKAGHQVIIPADVGLSGADDAEHLLYAVGQSHARVASDIVRASAGWQALGGASA